MALLNRQRLTTYQPPAGVTVGTTDQLPETVLQFGEGNFLRAFVDWMIDRANAAGHTRAGVVVVQPIEKGLASMLNDQDGLYTCLIRGKEKGAVVDRRRVVTSVTRAINPYADWAALMACATAPAMRFLVSNTTEAGITYESLPKPAGCPKTFPAKVTAVLHARFEAFSGATDKGLVMIPCELIERNGDKLKDCVLRYAADWGLGDAFQDWVKSACHFLNTLVDRIVPGYPREEAAAICDELGYEDKLLDAGEVFHLWVIEGPKAIAEELPLHKAGLEVIWTDDMTPYRTRKVRILNGAHTASVLGAYLSGLETVGEMMQDPVHGAFLRGAILEEVAPYLPLPEAEVKAFAEAVFERFENPFIRHELISISLNSVSKWRVRVLPSVKAYHEATKRLPRRLVFSLAALLDFYRCREEGEGYLGTRGEGRYPVRDDAEILSAMAEAWADHDQSKDTAVLVKRVLGEPRLWEEDLSAYPGMIEMVTISLDAILTLGVHDAAKAVVEGVQADA